MSIDHIIGIPPGASFEDVLKGIVVPQILYIKGLDINKKPFIAILDTSEYPYLITKEK